METWVENNVNEEFSQHLKDFTGIKIRFLRRKFIS